ncbi:MAG TPA: hypothetical protein ENO20_00845, partial [Bacteroides sp.]|nr:hypothetical protein [Bacteroides sp.]
MSGIGNKPPDRTGPRLRQWNEADAVIAATAEPGLSVLVQVDIALREGDGDPCRVELLFHV